jgi:prevent-host-death family protein
MKKVALSDIKDQLSRYLRVAQREDVLITLHGKPAGILVGFGSEDDWFDYRLEHDPRFLGRIERARRSVHEGRAVRLEDIGESHTRRPSETTKPARWRARTPAHRRRAGG